MQCDVRDFVSACFVCTQNKESKTHPQGLLHPFPIPKCPWYYISLDFITGLPKAFGHLIMVSICLSSGLHPQSNGQTERVNQKIEMNLRCLASNNHSTWSSRLIWAEFAHNTLYSSSLGMSPFKCNFHFPPPLFPEQSLQSQVPAATLLVQRCRRPGGEHTQP